MKLNSLVLGVLLLGIVQVTEECDRVPLALPAWGRGGDFSVPAPAPAQPQQPLVPVPIPAQPAEPILDWNGVFAIEGTGNGRFSALRLFRGVAHFRDCERCRNAFRQEFAKRDSLMRTIYEFQLLEARPNKDETDIRWICFHRIVFDHRKGAVATTSLTTEDLKIINGGYRRGSS